MAKIKGKLVVLEISTDTGTTWKKTVCEISSGANFTRETTTAPIDKCTDETAPQQITLLGYGARFPFEAYVSDSPAVGELTYGDYLTLFTNGTKVKVRRQYDNTGSDFYVTADAYLLTLGETSPADGFVTFSGEWAASGALDIAP
jgi:hypothetical protein